MAFIVTAAPARMAPGKLSWFAAPAGAIAYPFVLMVLHAAIGWIDAGHAFAWVIAALALALALCLPLTALLAATRLGRIARPAPAERTARRVALLAVAAPPLFTFAGVICLLLGAPAADVWVVTALWLASAAAIACADQRSSVAPPAAPQIRLRQAHGLVAALVLVFIAAHLMNHLAGLLGPDAHAAVMAVLRTVYRAAWVEPILLALFLAVMLSGARLAWRLTGQRADAARTFQMAGGVCVLFALVSHLTAVLYLARVHFGVPTDWAFASGAPAGMLRDAWNIRLVPYYLLAVFFVLAHACAGLRMILRRRAARTQTHTPAPDAVMLYGIVCAAAIATAIMLALCGVRLAL